MSQVPLPPGFEAMIAARRARRRRRRIIAVVLAVALAAAATVAGARLLTDDPGADPDVETSLDAATSASPSGSPSGSSSDSPTGSTTGSPTGSPSGSATDSPSTEPSTPATSSGGPPGGSSTQGSLVVLNVVDVSGSMAGQIGSGDARTTKIKAATTVLTDAVAAFADDDEVGLWAFSGGRNVADYTELVPIGPMTDAVGGTPRRTALATALDRMRAKGRTSLYSTLTAAYSTVTAAAGSSGSAERRPLLVVVSDGRDDLDGGATLEQLLARIAAVPPAQRVPVMTIAFSSGADQAALAKIAEASGGTTFVADTAEDLARVYAQALTTR